MCWLTSETQGILRLFFEVKLHVCITAFFFMRLCNSQLPEIRLKLLLTPFEYGQGD